MNLIFIGFINSGKTTCAKQMSLQLKRPFFDTDEYIETLVKEELGVTKSYREIFKTFGNARFRAWEKQAVQKLLHLTDSVIAVGGGCVADEDNSAILKEAGNLIFVNTPKEVLKRRFLENIPAYADPGNPEKTFENNYAKYLPIYERIADTTIEGEQDGI